MKFPLRELVRRVGVGGDIDEARRDGEGGRVDSRVAAKFPNPDADDLPRKLRHRRRTKGSRAVDDLAVKDDESAAARFDAGAGAQSEQRL